ncbi:hypothetical protein CHU98_g3067 [Xylaria longipes]|nr:hypothetical protein CHU98_g3067 [Xylaria longipes]
MDSSRFGVFLRKLNPKESIPGTEPTDLLCRHVRFVILATIWSSRDHTRIKKETGHADSSLGVDDSWPCWMGPGKGRNAEFFDSVDLLTAPKPLHHHSVDGGALALGKSFVSGSRDLRMSRMRETTPSSPDDQAGT